MSLGFQYICLNFLLIVSEYNFYSLFGCQPSTGRVESEGHSVFDFYTRDAIMHEPLWVKGRIQCASKCPL
ncbi:hypothetical protein GmHk_04G010054 [Glycine max]|nr:hypothetical protein GmHk_04G010054 [Glycine max]